MPRLDFRIGRCFFFGAKLPPPLGRIGPSSFRPVFRVPSPFTRSSRKDPPWLVDFVSEATEPASIRLPAGHSTVAAMRRCLIPARIAPHKQNPSKTTNSQQGLGGGRATRDVEVDGDDPVAAANDRVRVVVVAAAVGARAHRDDPAGLGHL